MQSQHKHIFFGNLTRILLEYSKHFVINRVIMEFPQLQALKRNCKGRHLRNFYFWEFHKELCLQTNFFILSSLPTSDLFVLDLCSATQGWTDQKSSLTFFLFLQSVQVQSHNFFLLHAKVVCFGSVCNLSSPLITKRALFHNSYQFISANILVRGYIN